MQIYKNIINDNQFSANDYIKLLSLPVVIMTYFFIYVFSI